ncbi:hypothetical protein IFM89_034179 [Coptis chinensis]|uniref:Pentatricopeptide repeat-containing protein n=1 Tax=Coptis chinensis TaxID=261450 RepID=A0A835IH92_9MAGN|nr:hypothetical protein IFM89_034179 [Coptis chinensis]
MVGNRGSYVKDDLHGAYLAAEPNTTVFNLAFGRVVCYLAQIGKAEQLLEMMPRVGLEAEAKETLDLLLENLQNRVELVTSECGILQPTEFFYAKLVKSFLEACKVKELAEFLIQADKEDAPVAIENSAVVHVISACILLGWLDQAHDLIDEMRFAGIRTGSSVYSALPKAYCKENRPLEISSLLRDARKKEYNLIRAAMKH